MGWRCRDPSLSRDRPDSIRWLSAAVLRLRLSWPLPNFFDFVYSGWSRRNIAAIFAVIFEEARHLNYDRRKLLKKFEKKIKQYYVPVLYEVKFRQESRIQSIMPKDRDCLEKIKIKHIKDTQCFLYGRSYHAAPDWNGRYVSGEVNRGCARSCPLCAASSLIARRVSAARQRLSPQIDRGLREKED